MSDSTATSPKIEQVLEIVEGMTVLELADLVKTFEDKFGVSAAAPVAVVAAPGAGDGGGAVEEKTEFDAVLTEVGQQKIQVIKVVRSLTGLGLKEAKEVVDSAPSTVKEAVTKAEGEELKAQLEEVGAVVSLK